MATTTTRRPRRPLYSIDSIADAMALAPLAGLDPMQVRVAMTHTVCDHFAMCQWCEALGQLNRFVDGANAAAGR
jgi:hypothetical protein